MPDIHKNWCLHFLDIFQELQLLFHSHIYKAKAVVFLFYSLYLLWLQAYRIFALLYLCNYGL